MTEQQRDGIFQQPYGPQANLNGEGSPDLVRELDERTLVEGATRNAAAQATNAEAQPQGDAQ
jgi:hypothetical protein